MAQHGKLINFRTREELVEQALSILLRSSSSSGLFAVTLDERQDPDLLYWDDRDRDNYWTVVFEVSYILWKEYCSRPDRDSDDDTRRTILNSTESCLKHMCRAIEGISQHLGDLRVHPAGPTGPTGPRYRYGYWMKQSLPFNNMIDDNNIVKLQDEWLYNEPAFLDKADYSGNIDCDADSNGMASTTGLVVRLFIDVPDHKPFWEKRPVRNFPVLYFPQNQEDIFKGIIIYPRSGENSFRQRIWAFISTKAHGWGIGKAAMGFRFEGDFFDKYSTCRFVVADSQLAAEEEVKTDLIKLLEQANSGKSQSLEHVKAGPWEQRRVLELMLFGNIIKKMATSAGRILELAEETVKNQKKQLWKRLEKLKSSRASKREQQNATPVDDAPIDYDSFLLTSNDFRKFQAHLQMIHGDFAKAKPIRNDWLNREKDRQAEQPRWTFNDESPYRSTLNKLRVANCRAIQDLERNLTEISVLAESITKELEYVGSYLEIMLFTYTTAIFLPLGFATGMFSMSETPDVQTVGRMFGLFGGVFVVGTLTILLVKKVNVNFAALIRRAWEELTRRAQARAPEDHESTLWETRRNNARRTD
ncbi:hypothetical protein CSAL01_08233 [Colletotrichum salicis]|uniref:Uncharacterized protein n=1 Tax=Colletotrichum salicis TaxID=1209931 RepID=A0A135V187_9PEZI|nr:hypothetical protein CSAL01_08233 [Colletotrichum salicis]